ncbi:hypothetical protein [uncultured Enterovirga sp.]|uniref:hypothetical protein n=1 Tax=uncultured Enterovirga sp. TaxID=2026352 RepID=UPI0035C9C565
MMSLARSVLGERNRGFEGWARARFFIGLSRVLTEYEDRARLHQGIPADVINRRLKTVRSAIKTLGRVARDVTKAERSLHSAADAIPASDVRSRDIARDVLGAVINAGSSERLKAIDKRPNGRTVFLIPDDEVSPIHAATTLFRLASRLSAWSIEDTPSRAPRPEIAPKKWLIGLALPDVFHLSFGDRPVEQQIDFTLRFLEVFNIRPDRGEAWDADTIRKYRRASSTRGRIADAKIARAVPR